MTYTKQPIIVRSIVEKAWWGFLIVMPLLILVLPFSLTTAHSGDKLARLIFYGFCATSVFLTLYSIIFCRILPKGMVVMGILQGIIGFGFIGFFLLGWIQKIFTG